MDTLPIASTILSRAIKLDGCGRYTEALICYQEGLSILLDLIKSIKNDDLKREKIRSKISEYMERAEKLKNHIESLKEEGKYKEQFKIEEDSKKHSYAQIFGRFLDTTVHRIEVEDPYIRSAHQCDNFLRFVELCVKSCPNLKHIFLKTGLDPNQFDQQSKRLLTIKSSLHSFEGRNIVLDIEYSESLHDREIRLDNGWIIKIGRGLDYFKPVERLHLGWNDYDLRACKETTVNIIHTNELSKCN